MKEKKNALQKLKQWIDGEITFFDAEESISRQQKKQQTFCFPKFSRLKKAQTSPAAYRLFCMGVAAIIILALLAVVNELPLFGAAEDPTNNEVVERYIESGIEETGAINFVAGMILDYRAFDTFGESNVLFLAVICVVMLLQKDEKNYNALEEREIQEDELFDKKSGKVLIRCAGKYLSPLVMLYGIYVILNGHLSPGGGFSGGSIVGAGLILYSVAYGHKKMQTFFTMKTFTIINVTCLLVYCACKSYSFFTGANHVGASVPKGIPGMILSSGFILPLNICVGMIVTCTMYGFYSLFTKGEI